MYLFGVNILQPRSSLNVEPFPSYCPKHTRYLPGKLYFPNNTHDPITQKVIETDTCDRWHYTSSSSSRLYTKDSVSVQKGPNGQSYPGSLRHERAYSHMKSKIFSRSSFHSFIVSFIISFIVLFPKHSVSYRCFKKNIDQAVE